MDEIIDLIDNYMEDKDNISLLEKLGQDINSMEKMINNLYYQNIDDKINEFNKRIMKNYLIKKLYIWRQNCFFIKKINNNYNIYNQKKNNLYLLIHFRVWKENIDKNIEETQLAKKAKFKNSQKLCKESINKILKNQKKNLDENIKSSINFSQNINKDSNLPLNENNIENNFIKNLLEDERIRLELKFKL